MDDASFLSLNPSEPIDTPTAMFKPQPVPKSPFVAFLLSLVFPGAGQIYCGKTSRGLWTLEELPAGSYRLVMMAVDGAGHHAKNRVVDFDVTD